MAMYYRLQGNVSLSEVWLAVAWQEFLQAQPAQLPKADLSAPGALPAPAPAVPTN